MSLSDILRELEELPKEVRALDKANSLLNQAIKEWQATGDNRILDQVLNEYQKVPKRQPYRGLPKVHNPAKL